MRNIFVSTKKQHLLTKVPFYFAIIISALVSYLAMASDNKHKRFNGIWVVENPSNTLLTTQKKIPPLNKEGKEIYDEHQALLKKGDRSFDRTIWCASPGLPRLMLANHPFEIAVSERRIAFMQTWANWYWTADMSGESWEIPEEYSSVGVSKGQWEGDTLVINTSGLKSEVVMDQQGLPLSWAMKITQYIRLLSKNRLEVRYVFNDPTYYSEPWESKATFKRLKTDHAQEYICLDKIKKGLPALIEE